MRWEACVEGKKPQNLPPEHEKDLNRFERCSLFVKIDGTHNHTN